MRAPRRAEGRAGGRVLLGAVYVAPAQLLLPGSGAWAGARCGAGPRSPSLPGEWSVS